MKTKKKETDIIVSDSANLAETEITAEVLKSEDFAKEYGNLVTTIDMLSALKKKVDAGIKVVLEEAYLKDGTCKVENKDYTITYIAGTFRETFDSKAFKESHPKLYKDFVKNSAVAASIRVTKKNK